MSSPSASVAVTVPIAVWFSLAVKVELEVKLGELLLVVIVTPPFAAPSPVTLPAWFSHMS